MLCPLLWKQDTRILQCYFTRTSTSPKPSHRYVVSTSFIDVPVWIGSICSLMCFFSLGNSSTGQKDVSQSNTEGHVWLEAAPPRQTLLLLLVHFERCLARSWMLNWKSSLFLRGVASSPKCPRNVTSWKSVPDLLGRLVQIQIDPLMALFVFKMFFFS